MTLSGHAPPGARPRSVTVVGWLLVAAGLFGFVYHTAELNTQGSIDHEVVWVLFVRLLAIAGGVFILRGANWARWLALGWVAYHVILSAFHSLSETLVHLLLLAAFAYVLLRPGASAHFRSELHAPGP